MDGKINNDIYNEFLKTEIEEFERLMGFGKTQIENIGIDEFINAIGFKSPEDVKRWRTDKYHLVICPECQKHFGIFEMYSICPECQKKADMTKIHTIHQNIFNKYGYESYQNFLSMFYISKELRDTCLSESDESLQNVLYVLVQRNTEWVVTLAEDVKPGNIISFIQKNYLPLQGTRNIKKKTWALQR